MGASVRGAIDLVRLGRGCAELRGEAEPAPGDATFADAAVAALSGRLRLDEGCERTPEEIVLELIERLELAEAAPRSRRREKPRRPRRAAGRGRSLSGAAARDVVRDRGRQTLPRDQLERRHAQLEQVSPAGRPARRGGVPRAAARGPRRRDRAARRPRRRPPTRSCAPRPAGSPRGCSCAPAGSAASTRRGYRRLSPGRAGGEGDLDLDLTFEVAGGRPAARRRAGRPPLGRAAARAVPARRPQRLDGGPRGRAGRDGRAPRWCSPAPSAPRRA